MALADNLTFYHTFASLTPDWPTSGLTKSTPSGHADISVSAGIGTCGTGSGGVSTTWTLGSGEFIAGGTGDFTVGIKAKITTGASDGNIMVYIGNSGVRALALSQKSTVNLNLKIIDPASGTERATGNSVYTVGNYFTLVARRASGICTLWVDGVNSGTGTSWNSFDLTSTYEDITIGSTLAAGTDLNGAVDFVCVWDRALSDSEIINNMNEADISAALGLGGGGGTTKANLIKQVSRYHLGVGSLGRIQRRS